MNFRFRFSVALLVLGIISAIMSFRDARPAGISPEQILDLIGEKKHILTADQLAYFISEADSAIQIVDIRNHNDFRRQSLPGAVNIPFERIFNKDNEKIFRQKDLNKIIVDEEDHLPMQAWILAMQAGYTGTYILKGGMTEWDSIVMLSEFKGDKITPLENNLFEIRYKARRLYNQWNSMSDSLKSAFYINKKKKEKELVGGCE
jgi:rhodanese-related sulfurtransferase